LLHCVFDKSAWLREREIGERWPVAGLPETLHVDNGPAHAAGLFIHAQNGCSIG
jgi:hypothetical protein